MPTSSALHSPTLVYTAGNRLAVTKRFAVKAAKRRTDFRPRGSCWDIAVQYINTGHGSRSPLITIRDVLSPFIASKKAHHVAVIGFHTAGCGDNRHLTPCTAGSSSGVAAVSALALCSVTSCRGTKTKVPWICGKTSWDRRRASSSRSAPAAVRVSNAAISSRTLSLLINVVECGSPKAPLFFSSKENRHANVDWLYQPGSARRCPPAAAPARRR